MMVDRPSPYRSILVGTDGSVTASRAVAQAARLAAAVGAKLVTAYVGDPATGQTVLDGVAAQHRDLGIDIEGRLLTGDPADALLSLTGEVDLIVVGNKGMSGAQRFLLGSVPNKISHKAGCDVLIVHTET